MVSSVAIFGGGTGGHAMPALAVACELKRRGAVPHWFGRRRGLEADLARQADILYHTIAAGGVRGKSLPRAAVNLLVLAASLLHCMWLLLRLRPRPAAAIAFGGYVSLPPAVACLLLRIPLMLHEQNARAGSVNRLLGRWASALFCGLPGGFDAAASEYVGNPVRSNLWSRLQADADADSTRSQGPTRLLVFGGSQGAQAINDLMPELARVLGEDWQIHLLCGSGGGQDRVSQLQRECRAGGSKVQVEAYNDDMAALYDWADLVLCRAGAMTLAELGAAGLPALLIPLPNAIDDHQRANADFWQSQGAAMVVEQGGLDAGTLAQRLVSLREKMQQFSQAAKELAMPDAARILSDRLLQTAGAES